MAKDMIKGKSTLRLSTTITQRYREPPNAKTSKVMTQYIHDYSKQQAVIPNRIKGVLVEATQNCHQENKMCMNKSGRAAVYGAMRGVDLGGSPDEPGPF